MDPMGIKSWLCAPQTPWQKGWVETMNKRVPGYLPWDTALLSLSNRYVMSICDRLNATPPKCRGYRTPAEALRDELMKLKWR
jgi:IS30 family transposase